MPMQIGNYGGLTTSEVATLTKQSSVGVESFAALRTRSPVTDGERVYLSSWNAGVDNGYGAGWFTGYLSAGTDDGGFIAAGTGFHWKREEDLHDLDVCDFGAVPDGVTDCATAATALLEFKMSSTATGIAGISSVGQPKVKFPVGTFYVTPVDWRTYGEAIDSGSDDLQWNASGYYAHGGIHITGAETAFGKTLFTRIISDKSTSPVFQLNHRRMSVSNIEWYGQQTTGYDSETQLLVGASLGDFNSTASNTQPFLYNECPGGLFARITNFNARDTGNYTFYLLDTLDSKFDQIYSSKTAGPVFQIGWSNRTAGSWDHSTAIELTNANFQYAFAPAVWAPRSTQCLMRNVWFEHSAVAFDLNNAQWLFEMVSVESSTQQPIMWRNRTSIDGFSGPTGNYLDYTTSPTDAGWAGYTTNPDGSAIGEWLSAYERGYNRRESFGAELSGTFKTKWYSGVIRGTNNSASSIWMNIGSFFTPNVGGQWEIEVISREGYSSVGSSIYPVIADRSPGKTIINVQRGSATTPIITYYHVGTSGVKAVQYEAQTFNDTLPALWVQLAAYCGEYLVNVKSTSPTRFDSGTCGLFTLSGATQSSSPGQTAATPRFGIHNGSAGVGAQGSNLAVSTATGTPTDTETVTGYMAVIVNGTVRYIPYFT